MFSYEETCLVMRGPVWMRGTKVCGYEGTYVAIRGCLWL